MVPGNELQADFGAYFDAFNVSVVYPDISYTRKVGESTRASSRGGEVPGFSFDDVRNEFGMGVTQALGAQIVSIHGVYSKERDYTSGTVAGTLTRYLAGVRYYS